MCCEDDNGDIKNIDLTNWISVDERKRLRGIGQKQADSVMIKDQYKDWEEAGSFINVLLHPDKIKSFVKAFTSKAIHGPAAYEVINQRHIACYGTTLSGKYVHQPCPSLHSDPVTGHDYCKACGCGKWKKARLNPQKSDDWTTSKLAYPSLTCPRGRF